MTYPYLYPLINLHSGETIDEEFIQKIVRYCPKGFVQLRMKDMLENEMLDAGRTLLDLLSVHGSDLIPVLNDYPSIAHTLGFPYLHLGQEDGSIVAVKSRFPHLKIGVSTHTIEQFHTAQDSGADYVAFGPVFETDSKDTGYTPRFHLVKEVMRIRTTDVVFIGGITPKTIIELPPEKGVHAAVISALPLFFDGGVR